MAARIKLAPGSYYEDQDGRHYGPGEEFETDPKEAEALVTGGSAVRMDTPGRPEE